MWWIESLRTTYYTVTLEDLKKAGKVAYQCPAQGWEKYSEDNFQNFIKEHNIKPNDQIKIAHWKGDNYIVTESIEN